VPPLDGAVETAARQGLAAVGIWLDCCHLPYPTMLPLF
jgi:hypothetical protein